ncbi:replication initiator protein [Blackfly microvirus SF02]|uniref:Replication initiator protein n=1 Tax=Blackfly microvirus SF02 TaxID=2576452 RepID=A0A4P8PJM0_9VIRU|nr:replication initiator protein [Blackfly microvirus SF02]
MVCYGTMRAYRPKAEAVALSGDRSLVFDKRKAHSGVAIEVPCGVCIGCQMSRRREWAIRCMHEMRMHSASAFVTLTYDDKSIPPGGSLSLYDLQCFMKRLRKVRPAGLRFFACGEYGETFRRPHYHLLLLNSDFSDKRFYKSSASGSALYTSAELTGLWPLGRSDIGAVTAGSAAYVAGYVLKKSESRDYGDLAPEFRVMSRRPGLGSAWLDKFHPEAYKHDSAIMDGSEVGLPRFYDTKFELVDPVRNIFGDSKRLASLKRLRKVRARLNPDDLTQRRLRVREAVDLAKSKLFVREPT